MSNITCNHWNYLLFDYTTKIGNIFHIPNKIGIIFHRNIKISFCRLFLYLSLRFQ